MSGSEAELARHRLRSSDILFARRGVQATIAALFDTTPQNVTLHLRNLYAAGELDEAATCKELLQVQAEGPCRVKRRIRAYNLAAILAIGYRVRSPRGSQFRRWRDTNRC